MKKRKILFFTVLMILLVGILGTCYGETNVSVNNEENVIMNEENISESVVRTRNNTVVYIEQEANNSKIATLTIGSMIKRIEHGETEINGHVWDKVRLANGTEGYVFSENLEIVQEYENINFEHKGKKYDVYFFPTDRDIETEYPYYIVTEDTSSQVVICYNNARIRAAKKNDTYNLLVVQAM